MLGLDWLSVILGLIVGAFFGPWAIAKFTGKTGASAGATY